MSVLRSTLPVLVLHATTTLVSEQSVATLVLALFIVSVWTAAMQISLSCQILQTTRERVLNSAAHKYTRMRWLSDAGLAIARSWVRIPPVAAVYRCQLSVPSLRGRLMSSSLRTTG